MSLYDMEEGIHYECQRCGNCCRWPGEVPVTDREIEAISSHLGMTVYDFVSEHTEIRINRAGLTLKERPDGSCVFLDGIECLIQKVKPGQCAGFPNQWNFSGWRDQCEAIGIPTEGSAQTKG